MFRGQITISEWRLVSFEILNGKQMFRGQVTTSEWRLVSFQISKGNQNVKPASLL